MKIGIEAQRIFRKKKHGMDIYALELIRNLQVIDLLNEYYIFVRPGEDHCLQETANFHIVEVKGITYADWEQIQLPLAASKLELDLLHCTSNTAPILTSIPLLVTLHDIIYLNQSYGGGSWYQQLGHYYRKWIVPIVFKKANHVFTVSNYEKSQIDQHFGDSGKVKVIYNGISEMFYSQPQSQIDAIQVKYKLPQKFIFFLGNMAPKKNLPGMLKAYAAYRQLATEPLPLVVAEISAADLSKHLKPINERKLSDHIVLTGYIPQEDLPAFYTAADLFVYPSLRESFGIPIIEAMKCGTQVITSNTSSMPEVGGSYAVLTDPYKPESIAHKMHQVLDHPEIDQNALIDHAANFSWHTTARTMTNFYCDKQVEYVKEQKVAKIKRGDFYKHPHF